MCLAMSSHNCIDHIICNSTGLVNLQIEPQEDKTMCAEAQIRLGSRSFYSDFTSYAQGCGFLAATH